MSIHEIRDIVVVVVQSIKWVTYLHHVPLFKLIKQLKPFNPTRAIKCNQERNNEPQKSQKYPQEKGAV